MEHLEMTLQLEDGLLVGNGYDRSSKAAKQKEARQPSKDLQGCHSLSKRRKLDSDHIDKLSSEGMEIEPCRQLTDVHPSEPISRIESSSAESRTSPAPTNFGSNQVYSHNITSPSLPAIAPISTRKGEARTSLFELCKTMQWPMPTFKTTEKKSRIPIEFGEGSEKRIGFNSYAWEISLQIPKFGTIVCRGDPRADKKSSYDFAVVALLYKLQ